ncbi:hypothetical protein MCHUDSM44219_02313 [Mycolicibacterium chubuense]|uniref:DUF4097 domain-containing protein n=2 Tax=Mycolicibacterium chubuense TaxID=1800 RepID=A0A0J6Z6C1_MYCCU|nr:DUF4097 family beta strand repeat-containing protein [Mycolicibacterium chubuense]KMO80151.1 hypothetical protein MCHUDSM44219_02313 [Mycolicibacterium chubuense]SPY45480.1 Uncharacterised protein [Mycolicibacterium chubuense]
MTTTIAPPAPPPPLSPGGRTALRAVLVVAAAVFLVGTVVSLGVFAWGVSTFRVVTDSVALPATLRSIAVDTGSVPVIVRITSDRDAREPRVDMTMVNSARAGSDPLAVDADGVSARVTIDAEQSPILDWGRASQITLVLPAELARRTTVTTQQDTGVVMLQADIDQLVARTRDGAVVLSGSARDIDISNSHGDVDTRDAVSVSVSFKATTQTGDIDVDFAGAPKTLDARTDNGDVTVGLPQPGPYVVDASTGQPWGSTVVRVPQTRDPRAAASVVTVRSETGDVTVESTR